MHSIYCIHTFDAYLRIKYMYIIDTHQMYVYNGYRAFSQYSDTSANEDNSFREHIR